MASPMIHGKSRHRLRVLSAFSNAVSLAQQNPFFLSPFPPNLFFSKGPKPKNGSNTHPQITNLPCTISHHSASFFSFCFCIISIISIIHLINQSICISPFVVSFFPVNVLLQQSPLLYLRHHLCAYTIFPLSSESPLRRCQIATLHTVNAAR
jgi:hypothetical protein